MQHVRGVYTGALYKFAFHLLTYNQLVRIVTV